MLRYSLNMPNADDSIEAVVNKVLDEGYRTGDIAKEGEKVIGTHQMGELIKKYLQFWINNFYVCLLNL